MPTKQAKSSKKTACLLNSTGFSHLVVAVAVAVAVAVVSICDSLMVEVAIYSVSLTLFNSIEVPNLTNFHYHLFAMMEVVLRDFSNCAASTHG